MEDDLRDCTIMINDKGNRISCYINDFIISLTVPLMRQFAYYVFLSQAKRAKG